MAKMLNSVSMNGYISKMVELSDNFIVNGQVYDKTNQIPNPFDFCPIAVGTANEINLSKTIYICSL
jgi:hypothetical protein